MTAPYDLSDATVVVVIGTGAGGGTLANERRSQSGINCDAAKRTSPPKATISTCPLGFKSSRT